MKDNSVFRSLSFIEARIQEKLTVAEIADSAYFSKYHYQRLFRDIVGKSVMEYVTKRKLTLAGRELLETQATVLDIALRFGYDSHEGFLRAFKAYMGVTPSEYRKYGLTAISLITGRERDTMTYSNSTDEILRELNGFVVKAKETAAAARKCELCWYKGFWDGIADRTDEFAAKLDVILTRVAAIAGHPDEITNRFTIIKAVEDIAFLSNVMALHVGLTAARGRPEDAKAMQPLCG
ncbi:MAG: helix-turn-helix transcriptional regulator, partial [Oscillospiraceae bacterium]|nr:helix-turn-helix transcriptional regulator [Oscillospiraceae bacterium]